MVAAETQRSNIAVEYSREEEVDVEIEAEEEGEEEEVDDEEEHQEKKKKKRTHTRRRCATDFCVVLAGLCFLEDTKKKIEIYCAHFDDYCFYHYML